MSNVLPKKDTSQDSQEVILPVKSPENMTPKATALVTPSTMGNLRELTPITLGRSDWFPCTKKSTLNTYIALSVNM